MQETRIEILIGCFGVWNGRWIARMAGHPETSWPTQFLAMTPSVVVADYIEKVNPGSVVFSLN
jgi:hypothetical protein